MVCLKDEGIGIEFGGRSNLGVELRRLGVEFGEVMDLSVEVKLGVGVAIREEVELGVGRRLGRRGQDGTNVCPRRVV